MITNLYNKVSGDNIRSYQYFQALRLGSVILLTIILVKLGASKEEMSSLEWLFFLAHASTFFWSMGMKNGIMNFLPHRANQEQDDYIKSIMSGFLLFSLISGVVIWGIAQLQWVRSDFLMIIIGYMIFNINASLLEHLYLLKKEPLKVFRYGNISYISFLLVAIIAYVWSGEFKMVMYGLVVWSFLRFLYFLYYMLSHDGKIYMGYLSKFLLFASPLIIHALVGNSLEIIDGFIIEHYFEESQFAVFRYGARELPINTVLISALVSASIPLMINDYRFTAEVIKKRVNRMLNFLFPLSIILLLSSRYLYTTFYSDEYLLSASIFNVYLLTLSSRILLPQLFLFKEQKNKALLIIAIIELSINVILSLILVQSYGMMGVAYATVVAFIVEKLMLMAYAQYSLDYQLSDLLPVKKYWVMTILLYAVFVFVEFF